MALRRVYRVALAGVAGIAGALVAAHVLVASPDDVDGAIPSAVAAGPDADGTAHEAERFRREVLQQLARLEPRPSEERVRLDREQPAPPAAAAGAGVPAARRVATAARSVALRARSAVRADPERYRDADWDYLQDVFDGRVTGVPSEARAGVSLQDIDALGGIPYVEELRREREYDELADLGFENETVPWPQCLRTGSCRRDQNSSPP